MALYVDPKDMSNEEVWKLEQEQLKKEAAATGSQYVPTSRWWEAPKKVTFSNQRQPAQTPGGTSLSPYGYEQAFDVDRTNVIPGTDFQALAERNALRLRQENLAQRLARIKSGTSGGGVSRSYTPRQTIQTTETKFTGEAPEFKAPEYDKSKVKAYRQQIAGPAMRRLRGELQRALATSYENPNVRRHILRAALEGYGIGLGSITSESEQAASQRYGQEYQMEYRKSLDTYNTAMRNYLSTAKTITTTGYEEAGEGASSGPGVYRVGPWGVGTYWSSK